MSSSLHFSLPSITFILLLVLASLLIPPTTSTSRHTPPHNHSNSRITGFRVTLKHIDYGKNLTKSDLLQRAIKRGRKRVERLHKMALDASNVGRTITSQIHAGYGDFLMDLSIGTPPLPFTVVMDTGSDLTWTQCKPCEHCFKQPTPIFDPKDSSSYSTITCSSPFCKALDLRFCSDDRDTCGYRHSYVDNSFTEGVMATETFTFENVISVPKLGFGCGHSNGGSFEEGTEGAGLVGLGRGELSLVSQLEEPKFSYCLTSFGSKKAGVLSLGSRATIAHEADKKVITTPLIPDSFLYYVSLLGITIGETLLPIDNSTFAIKEDGSGGVIVDSGTTITYLVPSAFQEVEKEFTRQVKLPPNNGGEFEYCFVLPSEGQSAYEVPKFVFHFEGADLELPQENYFIVDGESKMGCLTMGTSFGDLSIIGNIQQQNMLVVYDLAKEAISFASAQCDKL